MNKLPNLAYLSELKAEIANRKKKETPFPRHRTGCNGQRQGLNDYAQNSPFEETDKLLRSSTLKYPIFKEEENWKKKASPPIPIPPSSSSSSRELGELKERLVSVEKSQKSLEDAVKRNEGVLGLLEDQVFLIGNEVIGLSRRGCGCSDGFRVISRNLDRILTRRSRMRITEEI